jgi:hypothetical protein
MVSGEYSSCFQRRDHTEKKVSEFPVPSRDATDQTPLGGNNLIYSGESYYFLFKYLFLILYLARYYGASECS